MMPDMTRSVARVAFATGILLLVPFTAMQLTDAVNWGPVDFVVMGVLLLFTGTTIELVMRAVAGPVPRIIGVAVVLAAFLLIWAELAVGIFGTPFAGS